MENIKFTPLPIDSLLPELVDVVRSHANVILTATPGAGKTTRLPPELLNSVSGQILVLQPRRLAAVAACERACRERGLNVGDLIGYRVRFESRVSARTRLTFMTDALALRRMIDDPELKGVDLVIIDEFHERNLNQDLILGLLRELQDMGRAIKIMIMSATLDVDKTRAYLGERAAHVDVPGRVFPLEITYAAEGLRPRTDRDFFDRLNGAVHANDRTDGDILVFLPGVGEITRLRERLLETGCVRDVVPLHGSLNLTEQRRALEPAARRRVILSTNVAEASVTVPGVNCVIDSGFAKVNEINPRTGFSSLELTRISLFNARQRAGRAARERAGRCYRMWTAYDEVTFTEEPAPESARADLSSALLTLAHFGVTEFTRFAWFDPPPTPLIDWALRSLKTLGALDAERRLTARGRELLRFPLPPRLGGLLLKGGGPSFARAAALLNERDFADRLEITTQIECDVTLRLEFLDEIERGQRPRGVNVRAAEGILRSAAQLERLNQGRPAGGDVRHALLETQGDRLCRRRGAGGRAVMVGGRGVRLAPESQVRTREFFLSLDGIDLPGQPDTQVRIASGFTKDEILSTLGDQIVIENDIYLDEVRGAFMNRRRRRFADLELDEPTVSPVAANELGDRLMEAMRDRYDWLVARHDDLRAWDARLRFLLRHQPDAVTFGDDERRRFMELATFGRTSLSDVLAQDLVATLEANQPPALKRALDAEVPRHFVAPSGVSHRIHYEDELGAFVEVRLQEMFGLSASPTLVYGRVPLTFRLLGPNFRPVQVTSDLANFWRGAYVDVRKELRARYPKHAWPEDPRSARPEAKGRRRV